MISRTQLLVALHETRHGGTINLVASENLMSRLARSMLSSDLTHRYCIPPEGQRPKEIWDYPNQCYSRQIEALAVECAKTIFGGEYADVRPLSGNNAAYIVLKSLMSRSEPILSVPSNSGGHFTTSVICRHEGYVRTDLPYNVASGSIDLSKFETLIQIQKPKLIFLDASMQLFPYPLSDMRQLCGADVIISYDASHTMGLIAGGQFQSPLAEGADLLHGSTHKSLFGPQKGLIVCRQHGQLADRIHETITPLFVSNLHVHHVAALAVALEEMMEYGAEYAAQVVMNAQTLGRALTSNGIEVCYPEQNFTRSHQIFCKIGNREEALGAFIELESAGIHVNAISVPFSSAFGLRIGVSEVTRRGFASPEMKVIAELIARVVLKQETEEVRNRVRELSLQFHDLKFCFDDCSKPEPAESLVY